MSFSKQILSSNIELSGTINSLKIRNFKKEIGLYYMIQDLRILKGSSALGG